MKLIVGNWKMNGRRAALAEVEAVAAAADTAGARLWLAPPATLVMAAADSAGDRIAIGGQDCHHAEDGAHTGCISAAQLVDAGARFVILGHSERRANQDESDALISAKANAARAAGLDVIVCVGETEAERDGGQAEAVVGGQLQGSLPSGADGLIVAYEPVWAIGTGRVPAEADVAAMHGFIRARLVARYGPAGGEVIILYGGSVKPDNAATLMAVPEVGGALVGGASLKADSLLAIAAASA
ncbi:triose-phosphate isomerase [Polymorphobacter sp.]|uniref:triose-phosphate isomerase n=1 Tax=Polymorphobacter sp. TaxID=1909290 RepID=UPI003F71D944